MPFLPALLLRALSLLPMLSLLAAVAGAGTPETRRHWVWPLEPAPVVIARFDPPTDPWGAGHRGVDLQVTVGQQVRTPESGTLAFAGVVAGRPVVVVTHPDGLRSTLEPVHSTIAVGTWVAAGAVVGTITATPGHCSPATCLHWGVLRAATYLDPLSFVVPRRVILLPSSAEPMVRGPPTVLAPPTSGAGRPG